jgi:hypothetical protein
MAEFGGVKNDLSNVKPPVTGLQPLDTSLSAVRIGSDLKPWEDRVNSLMADATVILTFRGAGSVNGIDPEASSHAVAKIRDRIMDLRSRGFPVALMYDGDGDNRAKPDVGSIFGELADAFAKDPSVKFIAAQSEGWYGPADKTDPIKSSNGTPYETYVFANDLPGQHASLTQSSKLVAYPHFEQIFVGPAGKIAFSQLRDLSDKAVADRPADMGDLKVTIFSTPNNSSLNAQFQSKLDAETDDAKRAKISANIDQRRDHPYGFLCDSEGQFCLDEKQYPGLKFENTLVVAK